VPDFLFAIATPARSMISGVARRTISSSRPSFTISGRSFSRPSGRVTRGFPRFGIFANYSVRILGSNRFTKSSRLRNTAFQSFQTFQGHCGSGFNGSTVQTTANHHHFWGVSETSNPTTRMTAVPAGTEWGMNGETLSVTMRSVVAFSLHRDSERLGILLDTGSVL
jgi:hypothetical protein